MTQDDAAIVFNMNDAPDKVVREIKKNSAPPPRVDNGQQRRDGVGREITSA